MKADVRERIEEALGEDHACFVLITCAKPSADGEMEVKLCYEGDTALASYLIQGAQAYIDDQEEDD